MHDSRIRNLQTSMSTLTSTFIRQVSICSGQLRVMSCSLLMRGKRSVQVSSGHSHAMESARVGIFYK